MAKFTAHEKQFWESKTCNFLPSLPRQQFCKCNYPTWQCLFSSPHIYFSNIYTYFISPLNHSGLFTSPTCPHCGNKDETAEHLLLLCQNGQQNASVTFGDSTWHHGCVPGHEQGSKWDGICWYDIPALLWSAWNHTATSFWLTAIPVCHRSLNSCKIYCSLCSARNLSGKSLKLLHPDAFLRHKICQTCVCGQALGAYRAPPGPVAGFKGPTSKWRGGQVREGVQGRGREGTGKRGRERGIPVLVFPHFELWLWVWWWNSLSLWDTCAPL